METLFIPNESDFKRWIRDAVRECFENKILTGKETNQDGDKLLSRKEIAEFLRISLVTLNDWVNRGLPSHKQRGRVYFDKREVKNYIKNNKMGEFRFGSRFKKIGQEIA
jgi:DNA-binding transcriptional regulator YhcF (GntR family)